MDAQGRRRGKLGIAGAPGDNVALFLTVAFFAGVSASSPALSDSSTLRDPFAPRVVSETAAQESDLVDPFARPRSATLARTSTELSDPFAARRPDYGLRDPFDSPAPAPRLAAATESSSTELADPFEVRRPERAASSGNAELRDPFAR
jgi:hypothetical protein